MTDHSATPPQIDFPDVPPTAESLLDWARRVFDMVPPGALSSEWEHQYRLWVKSYEMYRSLPPVNTWQPDLLPDPFPTIESTPEATLTLLSDAGPILGCPAGTRPDRAVQLNHLLAEWWTGSGAGMAPLILPFPVDVRDLRG